MNRVFMNKESLPSATRECCHFTLPLHYIYVCYTCVQRPRALYQIITKSYGNHNGPMPRPSQKPLPEPLREQEPALSGSRPGCIQARGPRPQDACHSWKTCEGTSARCQGLAACPPSDWIPQRQGLQDKTG